MTDTLKPVMATPDGLVIDTSRQYKTNANQCPKCGHFKTWEFTVLNSTTGKQIPGHVTKEGFKIGNGDCPYYEKLSKAKTRKQERKYQPSLAPAQNVASSMSITSTQSQQTQQVPRSPGSQSSNEISITIGSIKVVMVMKDALQVAKDILDQVITRQ
jgi:hypothetical protein